MHFLRGDKKMTIIGLKILWCYILKEEEFNELESTPFWRWEIVLFTLFFSNSRKIQWSVTNFTIHYGPDHVQVFWKHKSIGNQASDSLTYQSEAWFPIDLCIQNTYLCFQNTCTWSGPSYIVHISQSIFRSLFSSFLIDQP